MATDYYKMGLGLGGAYFDGKEDKRQRDYQDEKRARETTQFNDQQTELQYQRTKRQGVDDAFSELQGLQTNGVYTGGNTSGMSDGSAEMLFRQGGQKQVDETASYANLENRRMGLAPAQTTSAPNAPTVQSRKATALDDNRGMQRVAMARQDMGALQSLKTQSVDLEWDDEFGTRLKEYKGTPEQIAEGSKYANQKSSTLTVGAPDKDGFIQYAVTRPDGSAVFPKMSQTEQAQLYAAGGMLQRNPAKALAIIAGINKDLAASVAADNGLTEFMGKNTNDVAGKRGEIKNRADALVETSRHNKAVEGIHGAQLGISRDGAAAAANAAKMGQVRQYQDPVSGEVREMYPVTSKGGGVTWEEVPTPAGMKPYSLTQKSPLAPEAQQKYRDARTEMGLERPAEVVSMFGGKDDSKGLAWDARLKSLNSLYGVGAAAPGKAGGSVLDQKIAAHAQGGTPMAAPAAPLGRVLSEAAPSRGMMGFGGGEPSYNVEMPDGTTRMVSASEMGRLGYPMESVGGRMRYSPDYK